MQGDSAAYHGYWGLDFTRVDPHLGTNADFAAFVECAHRLGLKVYLDIVVNHTADVILLSGGSSYRTPEETPYRDCKGKPYSAQRYAGGKRFPVPFGPLPAARADRASGEAGPQASGVAERRQAIPQPRRHRVLVVLARVLRAGRLLRARRRLHGAAVRRGRARARCGATGSAPTRSTASASTPRSTSTARSSTPGCRRSVPLPAPPASPPSRSSARSSRPTLRRWRRSCASVACRTSSTSRCRTRSCATPAAPPARAASRRAWATTTTSGSANGVAPAPVTFLGNHDVGRAALKIKEQGGGEGAELLARDLLGHSLLYLLRGAPAVYYGDEVGMLGARRRQGGAPGPVPDERRGVADGGARGIAADRHRLVVRSRRASRVRAPSRARSAPRRALRARDRRVVRSRGHAKGRSS